MSILALGPVALRLSPLTCGSAEISPTSLQTAISGLSDLIERQAVGCGRVAILLGNSTAFVVALLSCIATNRAAVLVNPALKKSEIQRAMVVSDACCVVTSPDRVTEIRELYPFAECIGEIAVTPGERIILWSIDRSTQTNSADAPEGRESFIQFTSGVSGASLAVCRTDLQAANEISNFAQRIELSEADVVACPVPLFHSFGLFAGLLSSLHVGARVVIMPTFSTEDVERMMGSQQPSIFLGVPIVYEALGRSSKLTAQNLSSLRLSLSAGGPLSSEVATAFESRFGKRISQLYGSTEAGVISVNAPDVADGPSGFVGKPLSDRRIRIVNEQGVDVGPGEQGEIVLNSPATAVRYLKQQEITNQKMRDGWYFTGDLGKLDSSGGLCVTGRRSTFINVGGFKVDPVAVEEVIISSGEVRECAVVGVARQNFGEAIHAYVVLRPDGSLERVRAHCRRELASFKVPRMFKQVETLPRSATGKVLRMFLTG